MARPGSAAALSRSLRTYYGDPARARAMDALYRRFLKPGDLAFDIGAHVGDRIAAFRRLGARVLALLAHELVLDHGRPSNAHHLGIGLAGNYHV